ncbi:hypothetical protein AAEX28_10100 [Lentisphaerota bacterium WC36G]|nr:hypothetical protein LJT99_12935 [Lentisphaerae bacterium WC36]
MTFNTIYFTNKKSPRRLADEIADIAESDFNLKLARRPFNRFKPVETSWWLVPSAKMPFYSFGKFYFTWNEKMMDYIDAGFYIEKGLDKSLKILYPKAGSKGRALLMEKPWVWNEFIDKCQNGGLEKFINELCNKNNFETIYLKITGNYVDELSLFDPYELKQKDEYFIFEYNTVTKKLAIIEAFRGKLLLKKFNKATNFKKLALILKEFENEHFMWLKFYIFQRLKLENNDDNTIVEVESKKFFSDFLYYFKDFLK